jgi:hypothetical protein
MKGSFYSIEIYKYITPWDYAERTGKIVYKNLSSVQPYILTQMTNVSGIFLPEE